MKYKDGFIDNLKDFALERVFPDTLDPIALRETKENLDEYEEMLELLQGCRADEKESLLEKLDLIVLHRLDDAAKFAYIRGFLDGIELINKYKA